jgi:hypothetical protein
MPAKSSPRRHPLRTDVGPLLGALVASAVGALATAVLVGALAVLARGEARRVAAADGVTSGLEQHSVAGHVLAMVLVAGLTVWLAVGLAASSGLGFATTMVVAAAAGPMTVVAAPVREGLVVSGPDVAVWWRAVVAGVLCLLLGAWGVSVHRAMGAGAPTRSEPGDLIVLTGAATVAFVGALALADWQQSPGLVTFGGWALLAGGGVLLGRHRGWAVAGTTVLVGGAALAALAGAYLRPGGWPGVAGWERNGMQPPIILTGAVAAMVLVAPVVGATLHTALRSAARRRCAAPAR